MMGGPSLYNGNPKIAPGGVEQTCLLLRETAIESVPPPLTHRDTVHQRAPLPLPHTALMVGHLKTVSTQLYAKPVVINLSDALR